jgi:superfamily I DNA and/or RNA helicase
MVYFDDILIDNNNLEEHIKHLKNVLVVLRKQYLYVDMKNYDFCMKKKCFLDIYLKKRDCVYLIVLFLNF